MQNCKIYIIIFTLTVVLKEMQYIRGSYRGSLAQFMNGKIRGSWIMDIKNLFSGIAKLSK